MEKTRDSTNIAKRLHAAIKKLHYLVRCNPEHVEAFVFIRTADPRPGSHRNDGRNFLGSTFSDPEAHLKEVMDFLSSHEAGSDYQSMNMILGAEERQNVCTRPEHPFTFPHPNSMQSDSERATEEEEEEVAIVVRRRDVMDVGPTVEEMERMLDRLTRTFSLIEARVSPPPSPPDFY